MKKLPGRELAVITSITGIFAFCLGIANGESKRGNASQLGARATCCSRTQSWAAFAPANSSSAEEPPALEHVPSFVVRDISGREISPKTLRGKVALLDFWATWCAPCRQEIPHFNQLYAKYRSCGFVIVGLALDEDAAAIPAFRQQIPIKYPIALSSIGVQQQFGGINVYPTAFLIDRDGRIVKKYPGFSYPEEFEEDVRALLRVADKQVRK